MKSTLLSALKAGGQIQKENFLKKPAQVIQKESHSSVVTETDINSERVIMNIVTGKFPDHNILSEESGFSDRGSEFTWVIDPLDGTSNFAAGVPWFGVLIALFKGSYPMISGAYLPIDDKLYFAETGNGAFVNDQPLKVSDDELKNLLFGFSTDFTPDEKYLNRGIEMYKSVVQNSRNVRTTNSLLDMMYVAEGRFGGCINLFNKIWDIAAPFLIVLEAGGTVKDLYGNDLVFELNDSGVDKNYPVIVCSKPVYEEFKRYLI